MKIQTVLLKCPKCGSQMSSIEYMNLAEGQRKRFTYCKNSRCRYATEEIQIEVI